MSGLRSFDLIISVTQRIEKMNPILIGPTSPKKQIDCFLTLKTPIIKLHANSINNKLLSVKSIK